MKLLFALLLISTHFIVLSSVEVFAQSDPPKRELRGAWLSTNGNNDWSSSLSNTTEKKISDLIGIIDYMKGTNINAVIMQIRPACDAMYQSDIEPWSSWLTGKQGKAPSPFFDPLQIAIEESHKRGMELHASLNPYCVRLESTGLNLDEMNVAREHPEWVLNVEGNEILDPGIPEVRNHIVIVITDIITRYDVDAIHFDDYFYLEGITNEDAETFATYPNGFTDLGDWRRNNVNELLRMIYATIQAVNPRVKFGLDYGKLAPWWASFSNERHIYPGLAYYRIGEANFEANKGDITDTLKNSYYKYPALLPILDWKDTVPPNTPTNLRFDRVTGAGTTGLTWDIPEGEDIKFYVLYRSEDSSFDTTGIADPKNIFKITSNHFVQIDKEFPTNNAYYFVTALDWNNNESGTSDRFEYQPSLVLPDVPDLVWPLNAATEIKDTLQLVWNYANNANSYSFELATDLAFTDIIRSEKSLIDTIYQIYGLSGEKEYFWRVKAANLSGESSNSVSVSFATAFPAAPILATPLYQEIDVELNPLFAWSSNPISTSNHFILSEGLEISAEKIIIDTVIAETSFQITNLKPRTFYSWNVKGINDFGTGLWSDTVYQFKTRVIIPEIPILISPSNYLSTLGDTVTIIWQDSEYSDDYKIQVSTSESFTNKIFDIDNFKNTTITLGGFEGATIYYWRVRGNNNRGSSNFSETFMFSTGYPTEPILVYPVFQQLDVEIDPTLKWTSSSLATEYKVQLSEGLNLDLNKLIIDSIVVDTILYFNKLDLKSFYSWRIMASNEFGSGMWTSVFKFKTAADTTLGKNDIDLTLPQEYTLEQNYPNPFNPVTTISFGIPESGMTSLRVYNIIGQEIAVLLNEDISAGHYNIQFDATDMTSGLYLYKLQSNDFTSIKKMLLIK